MNSLKVLVVVDSIDVNDSSGSKANVALIKNLKAIGYQIIVLHFTRKNIFLSQIECIEIKEKKYNIFYFLSRFQRIIQRIFKVNLARYLELIFGFSFTFFNDVNSIKTAINKIDTSRFDLIITLSKAASFRPHYALNELPHLNKKWLAYIHDPYPFSRYPKPYNWEEPGYKIKEQFFTEVSKNAQYSAFPSLLLKEWMGKCFNGFIESGVVIPHQLMNIVLKEPSNLNFFDLDKFNVLHAGSLLKQRNPEGLIKGFQLFLENIPEAKKDSKLILLGCADYHKKMITDFSNKLPQLYTDINNNLFEEVFWFQHNTVINVILEADSKISPFLPGKFPHCVSANRPILHLGPQQSETKRLLGEDYKYHTQIGNVDDIANIIEELYKLWLKEKGGLKLNRLDLVDYLSISYLKEVMSKMDVN